jgi:hypothetical protein
MVFFADTTMALSVFASSTVGAGPAAAGVDWAYAVKGQKDAAATHNKADMAIFECDRAAGRVNMSPHLDRLRCLADTRERDSLSSFRNVTEGTKTVANVSFAKTPRSSFFSAPTDFK